ncbi:hypothetical protein PpBr36_04739 [Pyricularia pennisetigena]|uniref:hypothetical protein n=1 Tax=Pyricularia pennisetigena TaxID=1578925 RepID=UPI00115195A9|nr:hypothetical protein PpBr36_04739 [Pyricularia pennisetigena]TLS27029.1 hypothetical protein PpBr36_04739 [Pyricularia pennisetigena]
MEPVASNSETPGPSAAGDVGVPKVCDVSLAYISRLPNEPKTRALQVPVEFHHDVEDTVSGPHGHTHLFKWTLDYVRGDPEADGRFLRRQSELVASLRTEEGLLATVQEAVDANPSSDQEESMFVSQGSDGLTDEKLHREASVRWLKRELNATSHFYMLAKAIAGTKAQQAAAAAAATSAEGFQPRVHQADPARYSQGVMEDTFSVLFGDDQVPPLHQVDNTEANARLVNQMAQYLRSDTFAGFQNFAADIGTSYNRVQGLTADLAAMAGHQAYGGGGGEEHDAQNIIMITNMIHNKRWNEQQVERLELAHKVAFVVKTLRLQGAEYHDWVQAHPGAHAVREAIESAAHAEAAVHWAES